MSIQSTNGRWVMHDETRDLQATIRESTKSLSPKELAAFEQILAEFNKNGRSQLADSVASKDWEEIPVPVEEWLGSQEFIGDTHKTIYPVHKQHIINIFKGNYSEVIYCLHPDTRVPLLDGTTPTIKELADKWTADQQPFWIYAWKDGVIGPHLGRAPYQTGIDDYFKVTLDDGSSFTANARHQMLTPAGEKRMVRDLKTGDSLMPFGSVSVNHLVVSVAPAGRGPVYCLNVPTAGNFAIATTKAPNTDLTASDITLRTGVVSSNTGSIGYGKDYAATICIMRLLYELCCLRDPVRTLGLGAGEQIHIVPVSRTVQLAKRVVFGGLCQKLNLAPWFKGRFKETMDYVSFPGKNIFIVGGSSSDTSVLGMNVYATMVDEANFMGAPSASKNAVSAGGQAPDKAQAIYDGLVRRVKSRFEHSGLKGMIFLISSKRATDDFTERRIRESVKENGGKGLYVVDMNTWMARPDAFKNQKWHKMVLSQSDGRCRILSDEEKLPAESMVFDFPDVYLAEARRDPVGFTRDVVGIATDAYAPFISDRVAVDEMLDEEFPNPFDTEEWIANQPLTIRWPRIRMQDARGDHAPLCCPTANRHVHIDLSKNKCATGFCMIHQAGSTEVERIDHESGLKIREEVPVFHIDGVLRIVAPQGLDIDHGEVRGLVYRFIEGGFSVRSVSMDQWMSVPNEQELQRRGLRTEIISTVRTIDPYLTARTALNERRIKGPVHEGLRNELVWLELSGKDKVVAPFNRTKDVSDAWAGAVYYCAKHSLSGQVVIPTKLPSKTSATQPVRWRAGGDVRWLDEEDEELTDKDSSDGIGSFIIT